MMGATGSQAQAQSDGEAIDPHATARIDAHDSATSFEATKLAQQDTLAPGAIVAGRYLILRRLGQGGMGAVFEAYDPVIERKIAIKVIALSRPQSSSTSQDAASEDRRARFMREGRSLARLTHPNIVAIYDVGLNEGHGVYLAMELVVGTTLSETLRRGKMPWRKALLHFAAIADALEHAHQTGIVHRDLKPENLMVAADGSMRLLDFGLAGSVHAASEDVVKESSSRAASNLSSDHASTQPHALSPRSRASSNPNADQLTQIGSILGTPKYMAPEQCRGEACTPRTDVYAFFLTLYEALHGTVPFPGDTLDDRLECMAKDTPSFDASLPIWLRDLIRAGLRFDPAQRPSSFGDIEQRIRAGLKKEVRRRHLLQMAGFAGLATVLVLVQHWRWSEPQPPIACELEAQKIDASYNGTIKSALRERFVASGHPLAAQEWEATDRLLANWIDHWRIARERVCRASNHLDPHLDNSPTAESEATFHPEDAELSRTCLDERAVELHATLGGFTDLSPQKILNAPNTIKRLVDPLKCLDTARIRAMAPMPTNPDLYRQVVRLREKLLVARIARQQARLDEATKKIEELEAQVRELGFMPLIAEFDGEWADIKRNWNHHHEAIKKYHTAFLAATMTGHRQFAARMHLWAHNLGIENALDLPFEDQDEGSRMSLALAIGAGSPPEYLALQARNRAILFNLHDRRNEALAAVEDFIRAANENVRLGEPAWLLAAAHSERAMTLRAMNHAKEAAAESERSLAIWLRELGRYHFQVVFEQYQLAQTLLVGGEFERALQVSQDAAQSCAFSGLGRNYCGAFNFSVAQSYERVGQYANAWDQLIPILLDSEVTSTLEREIGTPVESLAYRILSQAGFEEAGHDMLHRGIDRLHRLGPEASAGRALLFAMDANAHLRIGEYEFAQTQKKQAQASLVGNLDDAPAIAWLERNSVELERAQGRFARAFSRLENAIGSGSLDPEDPLDEVETEALYAQLLFDLNQLDLANAVIERALARFDDIDGMLAHRRMPFELLAARIQSAQHQPQNAQILTARALTNCASPHLAPQICDRSARDAPSLTDKNRNVKGASSRPDR
jgi:serine/threonine-protein kinase